MDSAPSREVTAEGLGHSQKVDKKPKERVKTEHKDDINLEAAGSVAQFRSRGIFIPPSGSWWSTPGFLGETHQILI